MVLDCSWRWPCARPPNGGWPQASGAAPIITMGGHGEVRATPDTAMLSAGVSAQAPTAAAALAANNSRMQAVMAALKKLGVPDKDIQTSNFSVSPQYANGNGEAPRITGYQASNQVEVRLEDVEQAGRRRWMRW